MKTLFHAFAMYNGSVNKSIAELLEPLKKEQLKMEFKAYYPSIFETCLHNLVSDLSWLRRYRDALKSNATLNGSPMLSLDEKGLREKFDADYRSYFPVRKELDELIVRFVNGLEGSEINSVIGIRTIRRRNRKRNVEDDGALV